MRGKLFAVKSSWKLFLPLKWFWWEAATEIWRPSLVVQESTRRWEAKAGVDTSQRNTREFPGVTSTMASEDVEAAAVKVTKIQSFNDFVTWNYQTKTWKQTLNK